MPKKSPLLPQMLMGRGALPRGIDDRQTGHKLRRGVFEKPHWRTVLTTKDKQKAFDMAKEIGDKVRVEEITPKVKR